MGALFIQTQIAADRIQSAGQPPWETIELDAFLNYPSLLLTPFAETVRFSDYLRRGGESVRYYHLTAYQRGLTLALSPSSQGRVISGIYQTRDLTLVRQPQNAADALRVHERRAKPLTLIQASHVVLDLEGGGRIIYRLNCLESFTAHVSLSGSLRLPQLLLHGQDETDRFVALIQQHCQAEGPLFTPYPCCTIDAAVCLELDWSSNRPARASIQAGSSQPFALPLIGQPMII